MKSIARLFSIAGTLILCAGLFCNAFGLISVFALRILVLIGIILHVAALFTIFRNNEF